MDAARDAALDVREANGGGEPALPVRGGNAPHNELGPSLHSSAAGRSHAPKVTIVTFGTRPWYLESLEMRGTRKSRSDFGFGRDAEEWLKDQLPKIMRIVPRFGRAAAGSKGPVVSTESRY